MDTVTLNVLRICRSQFRALSNQLQLKQTFIFIFFDFAFEIFTQGPCTVPDLLCFVLFLAHDHHESVKTFLLLFCGMKISNTTSLVID